MKIFLSYGHDNAAEALVLRIKTDLAYLGHEVWLDRERIEFGDDWRREVTEGIIESDQVLAFLSEHSTRDPGVCRDEIAIALGAGKAYVFTILVQPEVDVSLPISVSHLQWLDMHDWQARQQSDPDAFEVWYAERFTQICAVIDHPDNQRFAGEISQLEEYLLPLDCTPDINSRLPGFTGRQWLLDEINTWREGDRSSRIFCLSGGPGMGKSAVVAWLAHSNKAQVIAAQFCRYNSPERRDPTRVIRSIAFQLATRLPDYRRHLLNQPEIKDLDRKNPVDLFDYLLANPLRYAINGNRPRQLIVIDALDETLQNGQSELTELIASQLSKLPDWLGWVVTSRPESGIRGQLEQFGLHDISADDPRNQEDVETYIQHWLPTLGLKDAELLQAQQQILTAAQGNFLYVRQLQAAIQQNIIDIKQLNDLPKGLSALYLREFKYRYPDAHHYEQELLPVLEILVASSRPIPTSDIEILLNYTKRQRAKVIERLGSYLTVTEQGVALFHKSMQDWLLDEQSAGADYFVEVEKGHQVLGKVLWEQFTQTEDLVSCLDSYMALELPEQLKHWSDDALLKIIDHEAVEQYSENIEELIDLRTLPYLKHDQQVSWGLLGVRLSEMYYGLEHKNTAITLSKLAQYLQYIANYKEAEPLYHRALAIAEQALGPDHPDTGSCLHNLASLLRDKDDLDSAEPLICRALAIVERALGPDHPSTSLFLNTFALILRDRGDFDSAEPLSRQVLAMAEQTLGSDHPNTGVSLNNLALILKDKGDLNSAEPLYRRALAIAEHMEDPDSAGISLNNLASLLRDKGDFDSAEPLYRRALASFVHSLGPGHPDTISCLHNLASLLHDKSDYATAELLYRRVLVIAEQTLGSVHSQIGVYLNNLGLLLKDKGDFDSAEPLYRQALAIYEQELGSVHSDTGSCLHNLAKLLEAKGDYDAAEPLYHRALAIAEHVHGPDHLDTRYRMFALARCLENLGHFTEAESLYSKELTSCINTLGKNDPDTHASMHKLGVFLLNRGKYYEAEQLLREVVDLREQLLESESGELVLTLSVLGLTLAYKGEIEEASSVYQKALKISIKALGENHPTTERVRDRIANL